MDREFSGGPAVKTSPSNAEDVGSIPGRGAKIPQAARRGQKTTTTKMDSGQPTYKDRALTHSLQQTVEETNLPSVSQTGR